MGIYALHPAFKDYVWGGTHFIKDFGAPPGMDRIAESWMLSCHPDGLSTLESGPWAGKSLLSYVEAEGSRVLGTNCEYDTDFPILVKLIDAKEPLSIQVHPGDGYALEHEGEQGKTEMWYIIDCEPDAFLYIGMEREASPDQIRQAIEKETLTGLLHKVPIKPGDAYLIQPGTAHAIGGGIRLAEVQQSSNLTYRLYDYGRVGQDGRKRELHIDKALDVLATAPAGGQHAGPHLADTPYFTVDRLRLHGAHTGFTGGESFTALLVLGGQGRVATGNEELAFEGPACYFIDAETGEWSLSGEADLLHITIPLEHKSLMSKRRHPAGVRH